MTKHREPANDTDARELELYAENNAELYRQRLIPIYTNLLRKKRKGIYDHKKAVKLMRYAVDDAGKRYNKEFGSGSGQLFNPATRDKVAESMTRQFEAEHRLEKTKLNIRVGRYLK